MIIVISKRYAKKWMQSTMIESNFEILIICIAAGRAFQIYGCRKRQLQTKEIENEILSQSCSFSHSNASC